MVNKYLKKKDIVEDYSQMTATEAVLAKLKSKNPKIRREAIESLAQIKTKKVVHLLIKALKDPAWTNRQIAAESLGAIGSIAIEPMIAILDDDNEDVHYWAIEILGRLGGAGVPHLAKILESPNREDRLHVVRCIQKSKDPRVIEPLVKALGDSEWAVRKHASEGVEIFGEKAIPFLQKAFQSNLNLMGNDDICYWAIKVLGRIMKAKAVPVFEDLLKNKDKNIRFYAIGALGETRSEQAVDSLIKGLTDESWLVRRQSFEMLEMVGDLAVDKLKEAFFKGDDDVKYWTVRLLGRIMRGDSVEILKKLMNTPEKEIRFFVVTALGETRDPRAIPTLIECFKDNYWQIRQKACEMVASMKLDAIPMLENALKSDSEDVRYWSVRSLGKIAGPAIKTLLEVKKHPNNRMRLFAIFALSEIGTDEILPPLIESLGDQSWPVRNAAGLALERLGKKAMNPLIKAIGSDNDDISFWAQKVLANFGDKAVQNLIDCLNDKTENKESEEMRKYAITALGKISTTASLKPLFEILHSHVIEECELVVESLGEIKDPVLVEKIIELVASTEDERIINWLSKILTNIGETGKAVFFKSLKHPSKEVRFWITKILSGFEGKDILRALIFALKDEESEVRAQAITSLDSIELDEPFEIVPYISKMLEDKDIEVRHEAYKCLGKLGEPNSIEKLVKRFVDEEENDRNDIISIFQQIETSNLMLSFLRALDTCETEEIQKSLVMVIEKICDSPLKRDVLVKQLDDKDPGSAIWGVKILSQFEDETVVDGIINLLQSEDITVISSTTIGLANYLTSGNWVIRDKVSNALTAKGPVVVKPLLMGTDKTDDFMKMNVFQVIENMGDEIIEVLYEMTQQKDSIYFSLSLELFTSLQRSSRIKPKNWKKPEEEKVKKNDNELEDIMARMKLK